MERFIIFLMANLAILHDVICINSKGNKPEKPLFVPSISYPALVHLHPSGYNTELLENAVTFPRYAYNHDSLEYIDPLQRQMLFQNADKRLEILFQNRDNEKQTENSELQDDNYDQLANSILFQEENKPEIHDLDRRHKRNVIYAVRSPISQSTDISNNREKEKPFPFGSYRPTTWIPYESRREPESVNKFKLSQRRQRKIPPTIGDDSNFDSNNIRTARPLETPDLNKEFPDLSFFVPIQTKPLALSNAKSESTYPTSSAHSDQLITFVRTAVFDPKKIE